MSNISTQDLFEAGCHFGHLTHKWSPKMAPFIFMEKEGIHLIDLNKTLVKLEESKQVAKNMVKSGRKILFVSTKRQAQEIISEAAKSVNMPYVTERWLGGMLTNYATVKKSIKKMQTIERNMSDGTFEALSKREKLVLGREHDKLTKFFSGIEDMHKLPGLIFIVDVKKEQIAVAEAIKLNVPIVGVVDTNSDPTPIDYPIPANDDSASSIQFIVGQIVEAIKEAQADLKASKDKEAAKKKAEQDKAQELEA